ncbi:VOC family protein [Aeromicrobium sp. HA]|uniref:VOC family protein n=1 Tax=Aeromicrobium sp. HA TaxID=3009077 RepID=UPI0022AFED15|nr:VOC family protein [Aeromicrobium sp. HA]
MTSVFRQWTIDAHDIERLAGFWSGALDYRIESDGSDGRTCHLLPREDAPAGAPTVWVQHAGDPFVVLRDPEGNEFCILRDPH